MSIVQYVVDLIMNSLVIAIVVSTIAFAAICLYMKARNKVFKRKVSTFLLFYYLTMLLTLTVVREGLFTNDVRTMNIHLFVTLWDSFEILKASNIIHAYAYLFYNVVGNIVWFIPFGIFLCVFKKNMTFMKVLACSFLFSLTIEVTQYIFYVGISDIDDIFLNTIGGVFGYAIYKIVKRRTNNEYKETSSTVLEDFS